MFAYKNYPFSVLGFCAWSGTGKTTLLTQLIRLFKQDNIRIAVIKHAHHDFDVDNPAKDSYKLRMAGAEQLVIASSKRLVYIKERIEEPTLESCLGKIEKNTVDLVLVEGFKAVRFKKIELHRKELNLSLFYPRQPDIIAVATNDIEAHQTQIAVLDINNSKQIYEFIVSNL